MSTFVADQLPEALREQLSRDHAREHANRALVICTADETGWPHPAMLSSYEVVAIDARNVRLATHVSSRTTRNMKANGRLTLILVDAGIAYYVKGDVLLLSASMKSSPALAMFNLRVDSVLADDPQAYENARITSGITVERGVVDEAAVAAVLDELVR
jgi:Pyridoxamine 5'-phosphate oxidase